MRLQLRRPLAATAVLFAAAGTAVITVPSPALAAAAPARVVSVAPAVPGLPPVTHSAPASNGVAGSNAVAVSAVSVASAASAASATHADDASSPTLGDTIKRIRLWQSLTSMGILVGALVLVKRLATRH